MPAAPTLAAALPLSLLLLALTGCSGREGACAGDFEVLADSDACGRYRLDGEELCACPVSTGALACDSPADGALLGVHRATDTVSDYGSWPPAAAGVGSLADLADLADPAAIDVHQGGLTVDEGSRPSWDELDVRWSPDGGALALGNRDQAGLSVSNDISLLRCGDDGWSVPHALPAGVWLSRWGLGSASERVLYYADGSLYRVAMDREAVEVESPAGEPVRALVLRRLELLARKPDADDSNRQLATADMDVGFDAEGDRWLSFIASEEEQGELRSRVFLSDLRDCDTQRCEAQGWDFCCRTMLLADYGPLQPDWSTLTALTNPSMSDDGGLISFHWDSIALGDVQANRSYVGANPALSGLTTAACSGGGATPGLSQALDCRGIFGDDGEGRPGCPDFRHCDTEDCATCVSIGGPDGEASDGRAVRNLTSFLSLGGQGYLAPQRDPALASALTSPARSPALAWSGHGVGRCRAEALQARAAGRSPALRAGRPGSGDGYSTVIPPSAASHSRATCSHPSRYSTTTAQSRTALDCWRRQTRWGARVRHQGRSGGQPSIVSVSLDQTHPSSSSASRQSATATASSWSAARPAAHVD